VHSLNELYPSTKDWPEDGPLKLKHVARYVLIDYISVVFQYVTLSYCITQRDGIYQNLHGIYRVTKTAVSGQPEEPAKHVNILICLKYKQ
jgi:hypothetical protein